MACPYSICTTSVALCAFSVELCVSSLFLLFSAKILFTLSVDNIKQNKAEPAEEEDH